MSGAKTPWNPSARAVKRVKNPLPSPDQCNRCGSTSVALVSNCEIYGKEYGEWPWLFLCMECRSYVGLHPFTGIPLGTLADAETRDARMKAKAAFSPMWTSGDMSRSDAYAWLAARLGIQVESCHIGWFDVDECGRVANVCCEMNIRKGAVI